VERREQGRQSRPGEKYGGSRSLSETPLRATPFTRKKENGRVLLRASTESLPGKPVGEHRAKIMSRGKRSGVGFLR